MKKQANYLLPRALAYHHRIYFILILEVMLSNSTSTPITNRITNSTSTWSHPPPPPPMLYHSHPFSYEGNWKKIFYNTETTITLNLGYDYSHSKIYKLFSLFRF